jgi:trehalose-6-phosphatase
MESRTDIVVKRLKRIMYLAGNGFYHTVSSDNKYINGYFLAILKEAYKALNEYREKTSAMGEG